MSRFYEGDGDNPVGLMWHANIERVCRGKRGQKLLREFVQALLALPQRRLVANVVEKDGEVCAVGALARYRGIDLSDVEDSQEATVGIGQGMGLGFMLSWQLGAENDISCPPLRLQRRRVTLDVPITDDDAWHWGALRRAPLTIHAEVRDGLRGYSPEERWAHLYRWATSRIKWNLPVTK